MSRRSNLASEVFESFQTWYGTSVRQAKERLLGLKRDSQESVSIEIRCLANSAHPTMSVKERGQLLIGYLVRSMDNKSLQWHLLTTDTNTLAGTVLVIEILGGGGL